MCYKHFTVVICRIKAVKSKKYTLCLWDVEESYSVASNGIMWVKNLKFVLENSTWVNVLSFYHGHNDTFIFCAWEDKTSSVLSLDLQPLYTLLMVATWEHIPSIWLTCVCQNQSRVAWLICPPSTSTWQCTQTVEQPLKIDRPLNAPFNRATSLSAQHAAK